MNSKIKGRRAGADSVTITRNEILTGLNQPEQYILALVEVGDDDQAREPRYVWQPFEKEPDSDAASVNYNWNSLYRRGTSPQ